MLTAYFLQLLALRSSILTSPLPQHSLVHRHQVLILGGGVAGVTAARVLHDQGIQDFVIVEARDELGGRLTSRSFGGTFVELGANWIQGTTLGDGSENPILTLAKKHRLATQFNDMTGSLTTYDKEGPNDYMDVFDRALQAYDDLVIDAGATPVKTLVNLTARAGYLSRGIDPHTPREQASEYYHFDWNVGDTPENSSWYVALANDFIVVEEGGSSYSNLMSVDQRGFKHVIQAEAAEFLAPSQLRYNSRVKTISYSNRKVSVTLDGGETITGDYAICTFSLGVLQNDDVAFVPKLPRFKLEAIRKMSMTTYTKIFLKFPYKFWFDTEMGLFADPERGRYPIWQSLDHENYFPGSGILFVTVTANYSKRIEGLPDNQVKAEVLGVLKQMFPNVTVPDPVDFFFPRWHSDPLFRGAYSNWPTSFSIEQHNELRANLGRLYFAGEALSEQHYGYLHGAYGEGHDAGTIVSRCVLGGTCLSCQRGSLSSNDHKVDLRC